MPAKSPVFIFFLLLNFHSILGQNNDTTGTIITKEWYGYVDAYYAYDFNQPSSKNLPAFLDLYNRHNEFDINNAILGYKYADKKLRASFGLHAGTYVNYNYAAEPDVFKNIYEGYAGFSPRKNIWIDAGVLPSHIGYESAISLTSPTLTRTVLAENSPYFETGVRISYESGKKWILRALGINGWQNIRDRNNNKALGTQIEFKPSSKLTLNSSTFFGNEQPDQTPVQYRFFHNFFAEYKPVNALKLALLFDAGMQEKRSRKGWDLWHGGALIANYKFTSKFATGVRAEYYSDRKNVIVTPRSGSAFRVAGASLNFDYFITKNAALRIEGKFFRAARGVLERNNNNPTNSEAIITSSLAMSF